MSPEKNTRDLRLGIWEQSARITKTVMGRPLPKKGPEGRGVQGQGAGGEIEPGPKKEKLPLFSGGNLPLQESSARKEGRAKADRLGGTS